MFCPQCGKELPEESKFCPFCGGSLAVTSVTSQDPYVNDGEPEAEDATVSDDQDDERENRTDLSGAEAAAETAMGGAQTIAEEPVFTGDTTTPLGQQYYGNTASAVGTTAKGLSKPVLYGIIGGSVFFVAAIITIVVVFAFSNKSTVYNLQDYTEVTFEGVEGNGTCEVRIKEDELAIKVAEGMGIDVDKLKNADFSEIDGISDLEDAIKIYDAISSINVRADRTEGLSNGDMVNITYVFDAEKAKEVKAEFSGEPMTRDVSGLAQIKEIDPFEYLEVHFEGTAPNAYATAELLEMNGDYGYFYFEADKAEGLKLGDVVTYTVQGYDEEEYKKKYGVKFSQTSKEYTVEGIESYVMENTALDDAAVNIMKEATEQYIDEYFADPNRESALGVADLKYEGYYLLTNKQSEVWFNYNKIFMVYSATVSSKEKPKAFKPAKVFFPVEYDDLKQNADGGYEVDTSYKRILGSNELTYSSWLSVSGYTSMDVMRSELVDAEGSTFEAAAYGDLA